MNNLNYNYLLSRIDDLRSSLGGRPKSFIESDIEGLTKEVFEDLAGKIDLNDLNTRLMALAKPDIESLRLAVTFLRETNSTKILQISSDRSINLQETLGELDKLIDQLENVYPKKTELELSWAIDFVLSAHFKDALLCAVDAHADLSKLQALASKKASLLSDEQTSIVWHNLLEEFNRSWSAMQDPDSLLPDNFFQFESPEAARAKLAEYAVTLKPRLTISMIRHGIFSIPKEFVELPRILTWRSSDSTRPVTRQEELLARSIGRLCAMYERSIVNNKSDLSTILGLSHESRIVSGPEFKAAEEELKKNDLTHDAVLHDLRQIVRILDSIIRFDSPIERALRQFKLGIEVMTPEIIREFEEKNELHLQKELCRFLLERNIFSVGTKFGRSETDLFAEQEGQEYTIEAKVFQKDAALNPSALRRSLVQLQNYLDQRPSTPRGILVIYNLTNTLLTSSRTWIQGRYWILPINLQDLPPSRRSRSIAIEPGQGNNLIDVIVTENPLHRKSKTQSRKPAATTGKRK